MTLFAYPQRSNFGRIIPKNKVYEYAGASTALKGMFVKQVDQMTWSHKLAPETTNIPASKAVQEIQIFTVTLKTGELKEDILRCMDRAIPSPILFELVYDDQVKPVACYKRPNEADSAKWVISGYFEGAWQPADIPRKSLPHVNDLSALYAELLGSLIPYPAKQGETLQQRVERAEEIGKRRKEVEKAQARLEKEKQFNRKVEMNAKIRTLEDEIERLKQCKN